MLVERYVDIAQNRLILDVCVRDNLDSHLKRASHKTNIDAKHNKSAV